MWVFLLSSVQAESLYFDSSKSDWLIAVSKLNDQVFLAGKKVDEEEPTAWMIALQNEQILWNIEGPSNTELYAVDTKEGMVVGCGLHYMDSTIVYGTETPFVWALDTNGQTLFEINIDPDIVGTCSKIVAIEDGWVLSVVEYDPNYPRSIVYTLNDSGQVLSDVSLPNPVEVYGLKKSGENIALAGFVPSAGDVDGWIGVIGRSGELLWEQSFGGDGIDKLKNLYLDDEENIVTCGYTTSNGAEDWDLWFVSTTMDGTERFNTQYGGALKDGCKNIQGNPSGDYLFAGDTKSFGSLDWDALTGTLNVNGEVEKIDHWGHTGDDYFYDSISMGSDHYWIGTKERDGERTGWIMIDEAMHGIDAISEPSPKPSSCNSLPIRPFLLSILSLLFIRWR